MNLKEMIDDNIAVLEAESNHQEMLAKQKLQRQREALIELGNEIKPFVEEAGYSFGRFSGNDALKRRSYYQKRYSGEKEIFINIQFEDFRHLKNTGESENFYSPHTQYAGQHCGSNKPAYIKIRWDDDKGLYHIIPNVAYEWNKELEELDPLTYKELTGTKDMIIERLAIVLANVMRYEKSEAIRFAKHQAWKESLKKT